LPLARDYFNRIIVRDASNPVWLERRGQVHVDMKLFENAIDDFNAAERMYRDTVDPTYVSLGLLTNRGLAYEGLYMWKEALRDYDEVRQALGGMGRCARQGARSSTSFT
jgi:tetratricopeptide (TPR) repeat protein